MDVRGFRHLAFGEFDPPVFVSAAVTGLVVFLSLEQFSRLPLVWAIILAAVVLYGSYRFLVTAAFLSIGLKSIPVLRRFGPASALGLIVCFTLRILHYYPVEWELSLALLTTLIAFKFFNSAVLLSLLLVSIPFIYHSVTLFFLFIVALFLFVICTGPFPAFPFIFVAVTAAPLLTTISISGAAIPMEFAVVFLIPVLLQGKKVPVLAGIACLFCCLAGIVTQSEYMGTLVVGTPVTEYLALKEPPELFYDFSWIGSVRETLQQPGYLHDGVLETAVRIGTFILHNPWIIIQILAWALVSYLVGLVLRQGRLWLDIFAVVLAIAFFVLLRFSVIFIYTGIPDGFDFLLNAAIVALAMVTILACLEVGNYLEDGEWRLAVSTAEQNIIEKAGTAATAPDRKQAADIDGLSLEETLELQKKLVGYIKKKFVHEVTSLHIDIAGSTKLKRGESDEQVVYSFTEYWKCVDAAAFAGKSWLLNRAGDGAIYVFKDADDAVQTGKAILKAIDRFNREVNTLSNPFTVRIGLDTGEIVADVSKERRDVFSRVLDISAHLQKMAPTSGIVISGNTYNKLTQKEPFEFFRFSEDDEIDVYRLKNHGDSGKSSV
jgi:class 3 adenylate cyclase